MRALPVVLVLMLAACSGGDDDRPAAPTPVQRELRELARSMEEIHPDLFHDVSPATFRAAAGKLANDAPSLTHDQLVVGLMRLTALPGHGHVGSAVRFQQLPDVGIQRCLCHPVLFVRIQGFF